ncbi:hypothetical protein [Pseudochelatococcus sp. G4_1912]|uniref:hypothetical protein n=1 Tax=Pseudochelatococcus sp. G4_1912 TaxID=3114288 RepID=UPI0039C6C837
MAGMTSLAFITRALARREYSQRVIARLKLLKHTHRSRAQDSALSDEARAYHDAASRDCAALADLYRRAEHPYQDVEESWQDTFKWRPPLRVSDGPFSSPAELCVES